MELLTAMTISTIALAGVAVPFLAERTFWVSGETQAEAQRDAQMILQGMAFLARESTSFTINATDDVTFTNNVQGCTYQFQGGPRFNGQFIMTDSCTGQSQRWVRGNLDTRRQRGQVTQFQVTSINPDLVQVRLQVTTGNRGSNEILQTTLYLRNA